MQDLQLSKEAEIRRRKRVKKEVENWLEAVQRISNTEMQEIEEKFGDVSYFSRAHVGKLVCQKIEEVEQIYQQGSFPEGVAVDGPPATGVRLPAPNLEGEINVKEQIWKYLMGDEVGMIGVCGMGGIGKTTIMKHINNQLLKESDQFDKVIWVTVSKEWNTFKLQEGIANSMKQYLPTDELQRAAKLKEVLEGKRYVLILDDVWEWFSLLDVGIPESTLGSERKVVITSRSIEVCKSMGCEVVKVKPLSEKESMNLFLDHVGRSVVQDQNLKDIVNLVVDQCGGLPLAIVTIAGCMKGVDDICEWRNALNELQERVNSVKGLNTKIFECLKFSYDRLGDPKIQNCFLYCSLYPEDFEIERVELIESWIDGGLLDDLKTRRVMHDRGHSILNKLENNCLLENATSDNIEAVKMHDVLRDMALYMKNDGLQFMVKAGMYTMEVPGEHEWAVNLEKVSLMKSSMSEIPPHISPRCPHLSTLLLQENVGLRSIPESLFGHIPMLKVLNLSHTLITHLPNSISNLKGLNALILVGCSRLDRVPSLVELRALKKLDLDDTDIEEVPHGIEMLENLTYLSLSSMHLKELAAGILPMISHLQCLLIDRLFLRGEEVGKLRKLEILSCSFRDMQELEKYEKSIQGKWPTNFYVQVGSSIQYLSKEFIVNLKELQKCLRFVDCEMEEIDHIVLPNGLRSFDIRDCRDFKCLSNIPLFHKANDLKRCAIYRCEGIEYVVGLSSSACKALHKIESLDLWGLCRLRELVRVSHAPTPPAIFSSLKQLHMYACSRMKTLFPVELLQGLRNLEMINVQLCNKLEEIIESGEEEKEKNHEGKATAILPKLKALELFSLPKLESICGSRVMIPTDSLQTLRINRCSRLKRIPLSLPLLENNGEPSVPPSLQTIALWPSEWWESVEWDQPNAKHVFSPFVRWG